MNQLDNKISTVFITISDLVIWSLVCEKLRSVKIIFAELERTLKRASDDGECVFEHFENIKNAVAILHEHVAKLVDLNGKWISKSLDGIRDCKIDPDQPKTETPFDLE